MPHFPFLRGWQGQHGQSVAKVSRELQTVDEADYERQTWPPETTQLDIPPSNVRPTVECNPSQRPLGRIAHDPNKRSVYVQEGNVEPSDFKETVAELLKENEYGIFRLVVPSVELGRRQFDEYVAWLSQRKRGGRVSLRRSIYGLPVIPPFSLPALAWTCLMTVVDLTWTAFGVPINVAFCSINYGQLNTSCTASDLSFGIIYAFNLLLSFNLGILVVNGHRKKEVRDGLRVAWYYILSLRFALDLAAIVPFAYLLAVLVRTNGEGSQAKWVNAVSLIRLFRLLRLVSVSKVIYIDASMGLRGWLSRYMRVSNLYAVLVGFQILVLINLLACVLVLLAYMHGLDDSWMTAVSWTDLADGSKFYQWYCAIYWVVTTTTTTGFGDFSPRWWAEQVVIGVAMVCGMITFGLLVGSVANGLARADTVASRLQGHIRKISQVNKWLSTSSLKDDMKGKIQNHFAQMYVAKQIVEYGEAELFADLPPYLRSQVASDLTLPLVKSVHAFKDLNLDAQQLIATHLRPLRAVVGQELCRQGDEADRLWLLESGRLVASRHKEEAQHVSSPALVGESLILAIDVPQCRHRPWTLHAALPCELWELRLEDLSRAVQIYPAIRLSLLDHVRKDLVTSLLLEPSAAPTPQDWCELPAALLKALEELHEADPAALQHLCEELTKATIEDGSLQARLSEVVDAAMVRDGLAPEAMLGLPLDVQAAAAAAAAHSQSEQQRQTEGPRLDSVLSPTSTLEYPSNANALRRSNISILAPRQDPPSLPFAHTAPDRPPHDTHHGPAPWGVTTEDAIASSARFSNPQQQHTQHHQTKHLMHMQQPAQDAQQAALLLQQKESSRTWHDRSSPPLLPQRQQQQHLVLQVRRVASHHQGFQTGSSGGATVNGGNGGFSDRGHGGGFGGSDSDLMEAVTSGLTTPEGGLSRQLTAPPTAAASLPPPPSLPPLLGIHDDPISAETGILPPQEQQQQRREQQRQQEQEHFQPELPLPPKCQQQQRQLPPSPRSRGVGDSAGRQSGTDAAQGAAGTAIATNTPPLPSQEAVTAGAPAVALTVLPPTALFRASQGPSQALSAGPGPGAGARRSMLSRTSSPFAALTAFASSGNDGFQGSDWKRRGVAGPGATVGGAVAAAADGGDGPRHRPPGVVGSSGTCTSCGACLCPRCGTWTRTPLATVPAPAQPPAAVPYTSYHHRYHSQPQGPPQPHLQVTSYGGGAVPANEPGPAGGPLPAMSLMDAIRGNGGDGPAGGGSGTAAGALHRRSAAPWLLVQQQLDGQPPSPRRLLSGDSVTWGPSSPTSALSRRSRMFGRSFAATARVDSLMRDTLWQAYSQRDEGELASPSMPVRTGDEE